MPDVDDLIRYENENSSLDFKAIQYRSHEDLIKDVLAMANASVRGDRYIIIGVKHHADGTRDFLGVKEEFVDSATYQQVIRENIEPEIHVDYTPHNFEGVVLGVLRISGCNDQPYLMRKQFGKLRHGDGFIRKGSHQCLLTRSDLDRIYADRQLAAFEGHIRISFDTPENLTQISIPAAGITELPSDSAARKIRSILEKREAATRNPTLTGFNDILWKSGAFNLGLGPTPYAHRSTEQLERDLEHVVETYREDDLYAVHEENAAKINLVVANNGQRYVEDASIKVRIPPIQGLLVSDQVYLEPAEYSPIRGYVPRINFENRDYPTVSLDGDVTEIFSDIGNLRHGIPSKAFKVPVRMTFGRALVGHTVELECSVFAKQLPIPHREILTINVVAPALTTPRV